MDDDVPPYIPVPLGGVPIYPPSDSSISPPDAPRPPGSTQAVGAAMPIYAPGMAPFPPPPSAPPQRKLMPSSTSLSANVSDLVLSSLLPANLPKLPSTNHPPGRARELTSQREGLGLNVMSNNFRRFVTKVRVGAERRRRAAGTERAALTASAHGCSSFHSAELTPRLGQSSGSRTASRRSSSGRNRSGHGCGS